MAIPKRRTLQELLSSIGAGAAPVYGGNANLQRGMSSPYMPSQTYPGAGGKPMMFPTYHDALDSWMANPSPGIDRPNPANWATPNPTPQTPTATLDPIPEQKSEAWWAAQPRPDFVPADWVYIGMGDWGPPSEQTVPGAKYGPVVDQPAGGLRLPPVGLAADLGNAGGLLGMDPLATPGILGNV